MESDPVIIEAKKAIEYSERQLAYYQQAYTQSQAQNDQANMSESARCIKKHRNEININQATIDEWQPPFAAPFTQGQPALPYPAPGTLPTANRVLGSSFVATGGIPPFVLPHP
jgi:hypothetical protein